MIFKTIVVYNYISHVVILYFVLEDTFLTCTFLKYKTLRRKIYKILFYWFTMIRSSVDSLKSLVVIFEEFPWLILLRWLRIRSMSSASFVLLIAGIFPQPLPGGLILTVFRNTAYISEISRSCDEDGGEEGRAAKNPQNIVYIIWSKQVSVSEIRTLWDVIDYGHLLK